MSAISSAQTATQALAMALKMGREQLEFAGEGAMREARMLLAKAAEISADRLFDLEIADFSDDLMARYMGLVERRRAREPMSHILGRRAFWGRDFIVTADVLDPRPETETLIAAALKKPFTKLLDLGVGSGAILLTLLAENPISTGIGSDLSEAALGIAAANAAAFDLRNRVQFQASDWWENVSGQYDLIVSNPPYIAADEMAGLAPELAHEPRMALTDEADGLSAYRIIAAGALAHLAPGGWLMVEIGPTQGAAVADMFLAAGLKAVQILPDMDGRDRVVQGRARSV
ncbi:MAG: release factor glutamine methyltransferase [Halocynthiibacter sp.]|jgi:release factor glutamine methyltransferase